jgi:hypothetical protein
MIQAVRSRRRERLLSTFSPDLGEREDAEKGKGERRLEAERMFL